jgi:hypothetical protein
VWLEDLVIQHKENVQFKYPVMFLQWVGALEEHRSVGLFLRRQMNKEGVME